MDAIITVMGWWVLTPLAFGFYGMFVLGRGVGYRAGKMPVCPQKECEYYQDKCGLCKRQTRFDMFEAANKEV